MVGRLQQTLFPDVIDTPDVDDASSSSFTSNMTLPVHRWFRYSAGFSAQWVEQVLRPRRERDDLRVFDPFAGSATTLVASEQAGIRAVGIDSHPFVARVARAKLQWRSDAKQYLRKITALRTAAKSMRPDVDAYPKLIHKCYDVDTLNALDRLRRGYEKVRDDSPESELAWLTLVSILRSTSSAGTAQWQYVLPKKQKKSPRDPDQAFDVNSRMFADDMSFGAKLTGPRADFLETDARTCAGIADASANLVITSPPYPNNYDYADAVRLEMSFFQEINGWGDLQNSVRRHLVRSCSQHVPEKAVDLNEVLASPELRPILGELSEVCEQLAAIRLTKGGKKTYHLMVACYFRDLALVWQSLRRVCEPGAEVCFVIGDSAPYGVYVPVIPWLTQLAIAAGFRSGRFEKTRDRNVKWKNRKHRVPLQEGRLWVDG